MISPKITHPYAALIIEFSLTGGRYAYNAGGGFLEEREDEERAQKETGQETSSRLETSNHASQTPHVLHVSVCDKGPTV